MSVQDSPNLGQQPDASAGRDAVHVAIIPMVAACDIRPGSHVRLVEGDRRQAVWVAAGESEAVGIADPFRTGTIRRGERFWLCLYPGSVTSLRHVWTSPAFTPRVPGRES